MIYETIALWDKHPEATLTTYCITSTAELKLDPRRAVVICPGGGYQFLSDREAEPIVFKFLSAGFNVFLLRYSIKPNAHSYAPLIEAGLAIKYVREMRKSTIPIRITYSSAASPRADTLPQARALFGISSPSARLSASNRVRLPRASTARPAQFFPTPLSRAATRRIRARSRTFRDAIR